MDNQGFKSQARVVRRAGRVWVAGIRRRALAGRGALVRHGQGLKLRATRSWTAAGEDRKRHDAAGGDRKRQDETGRDTDGRWIITGKELGGRSKECARNPYEWGTSKGNLSWADLQKVASNDPSKRTGAQYALAVVLLYIAKTNFFSRVATAFSVSKTKSS